MTKLHSFLQMHLTELALRTSAQFFADYPVQSHESLGQDYRKIFEGLLENLERDLDINRSVRERGHYLLQFCKKTVSKKTPLKFDFRMLMNLVSALRHVLVETLPVEILFDKKQTLALYHLFDSVSIRLNDWWEQDIQKLRQEDQTLIGELSIVKNDLQRQLNIIYQILKESPIGIVGCDADFKVQLWNAMATRLAGYQQADILKKSFLDILAPASRQQFIEKVGSERRGINRLRLKILAKDGGEFHALISLSKMISTPHSKMKYVISFLDLKSDQTIRSQFRKINQLAAIARLSSAIMHDIRNPINSLGLNIEVLEQLLENERLSNPPINEILQKVYRQIAQLSQSLNQYLGYARLMELNLEPLEISTQIANLITELRHEFTSRDIQLKYRKPTIEQWTLGDWFQLRRALVNIIQNAGEILNSGGLVRVASLKRDGKLLIRIEDNGPGIESERLKKIFDPYYSTKKTGMGLGLFIVREIVHSHKGRIYCTSRPGQGTRFTISLPEFQRTDEFQLTGNIKQGTV